MGSFQPFHRRGVLHPGGLLMFMRMAALARVGLLCLAAPFAAAQQIDFPVDAAKDDVALAAAMPGVGEQLIARYTNGDRDQYLDNLARFQLVAGKYADAQKTLGAMRPSLANVRWEI